MFYDEMKLHHKNNAWKKMKSIPHKEKQTNLKYPILSEKYAYGKVTKSVTKEEKLFETDF